MNTINEGRGKPARSKFCVLLFGLLLLLVVAAGAGYWVYWTQVGSRYAKTDNAYTAADSATVTAEIDGTVAEIRVVDTQEVKKGEILVVIDPQDAQIASRAAEAERDRAKAERDRAKAEQERALAQITAAEADLERTTIDLKRRDVLVGSGSVSADELTHVKNAHTAAQAALAGAQAALAGAQAAQAAADAAVAQTEARCDKAKLDLQRTVIRSPMDGIVTRRVIELGQRIQPSLPLLSVVPINEMYVDANYKEVQLQKVQIGQRAKLVSDLYGEDVVYTGVVEGFSGGTGAALSLIPAQNATGNWIKVVQRLPVRIRLNPAELKAHPLRVGLSMFSTIDLRSNTH
jgi:membrane fusion protein (multidrug efflux system)